MKKIAYIAYGALLLCSLLYIRFPEESFTEYLSSKLEDNLPASVYMGDWSFAPPLSWKLDWLLLTDKESDSEVARIKNVELRLLPAEWGMGYKITGNLYGGTLQAGLQLVPAEKEFTFESVELENVELEKVVHLSTLLKREISGTISFTGSYSGSIEKNGKKQLKGHVTIVDGGFTVLRPILTLKQLNMQSMGGDIVLANDELQIQNGEFNGPDLQAKYDGRIVLAERFADSELQLGGYIVPSKEFLNARPNVSRVVKRMQRQYRKSELPFMIKGSVYSSRFRFGARQVAQ